MTIHFHAYVAQSAERVREQHERHWHSFWEQSQVELADKFLTSAEQRKGCDQHLLIPDFVPNADPIDAGVNFIEYKHRETGETFIHGAKVMPPKQSLTQRKEAMKGLRAEVDVLTLTATPIPRTMGMALEGIRDLSVIATAPQRRLAIKTFVRESNNHVV